MPRKNPLLDDLTRVLDEHRARESDEFFEADRRQMEADREADRAREQAAFDMLAGGLREFMHLEARRVAAFEQAANALSQLAHVATQHFKPNN